jgi:hypothetical protein
MFVNQTYEGGLKPQISDLFKIFLIISSTTARIVGAKKYGKGQPEYSAYLWQIKSEDVGDHLVRSYAWSDYLSTLFQMPISMSL